MAYKKTGIVDIKVEGLNTIQQLEEYIENVNNELKDVDINSQAFDDLSAKSSAAASKLKAVETNLEAVTSTEKAEGLFKLGEGIAGMLTGIQGLTIAFGENNKEMEETIRKVGGLLLAMDGLRKLTEAFSAENVKKLKALGRGFTALTRTVKTASKGMKIAMASTGIGLLIVAVGLLAENWDKVSEAIFGSGEMSKETLEEMDKNLNDVLDTQKELAEYIGDDAKKREIELTKLFSEYSKLDDNLIKSKKDLKKATEDLKKSEDSYNLAVKSGNGLGIMYLANKQKKLKEEIALKETVVAKDEEELKLIKAKLNYVEKLYNNQKEITGLIESEDDLKNTLTIVESINYTTDKQYKLKLKLLEVEKELAIWNAKTEEEADKITKKYNAQITAMNNTYHTWLTDTKETMSQLNDEYEKLANTPLFDKLAYDYKSINDAFVKINDDLQVLNREIGLFNNELNENFKILDFGSKKLEMYGSYFDEDVFKKYADSINISAEGLNKLTYKQQAYFKTELLFLEQTKKSYEDKLVSLKNGYNNVLENQRNYISDLKAEGEAINKNVVTISNKIAKLEEEKKSANLEKQVVIQEKINSLYKDQGELIKQRTELDVEIQTVNSEIDHTLTQQKNDLKDIENNIVSVGNEQDRLNNKIKEASTLYSKMQTFIQDYNEELNTGIQIFDQSMELAATIYERQAEMYNREADDIQRRLDKAKEDLDDYKNKSLDFEALLKDANGERYDELKAQEAEYQQGLKDREKVMDELAKQEGELRYKADVAEWKAAKWRKGQAIIDSLIQTTLAVIEALPNIPLSIGVGILGALGTATIVAQPVPPKPNKDDYFYEGGYTGIGGKYQEAGVVHKGEYVVPQEILSSDEGGMLVSVLENMRKDMKGFADGGYSQQPATQTSTSILIDYDLLANKIASEFTKLPNPQVSVVEIANKQQQVSVIEQSSSL